MQIQPVKNISYNNYSKPTFKANERWVYDRFGKALYKTTSYYLRDDLNFRLWADYAHYKYKDVSDVAFVCHACSNGMEAFSYKLALLLWHPEDVEKMSPIIAKDINWDNIYAAREGCCGVSDIDLRRIKEITNGKYLDYFDQYPSLTGKNVMILKPKKIITDGIIFEQGDMTKDIKTVRNNNIIFPCRNSWLYMHPSDQEKFAKDISNQFQDDSATVMLGYFDKYGKELLKKEGFNEYKNSGIFSR